MMDSQLEFARKMARMAFHAELRFVRMFCHSDVMAYNRAAEVADETYDLVMSEDRPLVTMGMRTIRT